MINTLFNSAKKSVITILLTGGLVFLFTSVIAPAAPEVTFTTIAGKKIALADLRGKPVLVTFWATDCPGCIKEIPHLIDLYRHYHAAGLEIIAVAMYYDIPSHVVAMTESRQIPYDVVLDLKSEHALAFGQVQLTPSTFLISPEGRFVMSRTGTFDVPEMKTRIEKLLTS